MNHSFRPEDIERLAAIVRDESGNQVSEKNFSMLQSRMSSYLLKSGFKTIQEYWKHFASNEKSERGLILSLMTTHYTFFFREYPHFEELQKWITENLPKLQARHKNTSVPLQVWSAACSRGHEAYSLAMFLEENLQKAHGIPYKIWGTDIDPESIKFAQNGVYPIAEVNVIPRQYLGSNWKRGTGPIKEFAAVHPILKKNIEFHTLNLFDAATWMPQLKFDIVFCRNVFIYFSEENVKKISLDLANKIENGGLLFTGFSEPLRFSDWSMSTIGPSIYQKGQSKKETPKVSPAIAEPARKYSVLCVDDSPTIQKLMTKIFSQDPTCERVDTAENGKIARAKLDSAKYDLVTLDIHMPEVSGIEFLENLYQRKTDPPVIMVSSVNRTDIDLATKSIQLGAFDYVEKPAMNNLAKSSSEILTKAKMALRPKLTVAPLGESFDTSIAQKIVVPDASQCLRAVFADEKDFSMVEYAVRAQQNESRSPALIIFVQNFSPTQERDLRAWTNRPVESLLEPKKFLRPNCIYLAQHSNATNILNELRVKSLSFQVLHSDVPLFNDLKKPTASQLLLDESLQKHEKAVRERFQMPISDVTPATSFASLSLEFFARLRRVAA